MVQDLLHQQYVIILIIGTHETPKSCAILKAGPQSNFRLGRLRGSDLKRQTAIAGLYETSPYKSQECKKSDFYDARAGHLNIRVSGSCWTPCVCACDMQMHEIWLCGLWIPGPVQEGYAPAIVTREADAETPSECACPCRVFQGYRGGYFRD